MIAISKTRQMGTGMIEYDNMRKALQADVCEVIFEKKDGSERVMNCTLNFDKIPMEHQPKKLDLPYEEGVLSTIKAFRVFDVDNNGWRSFILDNVRFFNGEEGPVRPQADVRDTVGADS